MKRVVTAVAVLCIVIIYCISGILVIKSNNEKIILLVDEILLCNEQGDITSAIELARELEKEWLKYEKNMSVMIADSKIYNMNDSVIKILPYLENGNDDLKASLENIRHQVTIMHHTEIPAWYSIL